MKKFVPICLFFMLALLWLKADAGCRCSCSSGNEKSCNKCSIPNPGIRSRQIKQCVYKDINDDRNVGHIRSCDFKKVEDNTVLRVTFQGNLRVVGCASGCCRRWFITINGEECSSPATIDAVVYAGHSGTANHHIPGTLDGFCSNIPKGQVNVGISIAACPYPYPTGDGYTGWKSVSRFIIEEVPPLQ